VTRGGGGGPDVQRCSSGAAMNGGHHSISSSEEEEEEEKGETELSYSNNSSGRSRTLHPHVLAALREGRKSRGSRPRGPLVNPFSTRRGDAANGTRVAGAGGPERGRGGAQAGGRDWGDGHLQLPDRVLGRGGLQRKGGGGGRGGRGMHVSAGVGRVAAGSRRGWISCVRCGERHHWNTKCGVEPLQQAQGPMSLKQAHGPMSLCSLPVVEAECVLLASRCVVLVRFITVCVCVCVCASRYSE
jgi:hypothetical protein